MSYGYQPVNTNDPNKQQPPYYPQPYGPQQYELQPYGVQPNQYGQPQYASTYVYNSPTQPQQPQPYPAGGGYGGQYGPGQYGGGSQYAGDPGYQGGPDDSKDEVNETITAFREKSVRQGFIRKVYCILFVQLLVSVAIVAVFITVESVGNYVRKTRALFWTAWIFTVILMIAIACCENVRRSFPLNYILLGAFTLCEGYLLGVISAYYKMNEVLMALGIVTIVSLGITLFALQTKIDFTMMGGCLFVAMIVLLCFGILTIFFHNKIIRLVYACLGALIFGLYLVFDTQIMMGGGKQYALSPEDYVFAALNLYIDIIMLYIHILQIIGIAGES